MAIEMYALDRLTAEKQTWDYAIIHAKGIQPMVLEWKDKNRIRRIREQALVEITKTHQEDPFNPPRGPVMGPEGMMPAHPGYLVDVCEYFYEEEIVRITFFFNKRINTQALDAMNNAQPVGEEGSLILTADGENQQTAKEYEEGKAELEKGKKKSPLKKA